MMTMEQEPYGFKNAAGASSGVLYDILNEIILLSGVGNTNQIVPSKRLLSVMKNKTNACTIVADTPDVLANFVMISPIGYTVTVGILPSAGITLNDYSNLQGIIIAVPLGVYFNEKFHFDTSLTKVSPPQYVNAIGMLKKGRVDAVAGAISSLKYIAKKEGMTNKHFGTPFIFATNEMHLVCTKTLLMTTRKKLKQALIKLQQSERIKMIVESYQVF